MEEAMLVFRGITVKEVGVPYNHEPRNNRTSCADRSPYNIDYFNARAGMPHYAAKNSRWGGGFTVRNNKVYTLLHDHWASSLNGYVQEHILVAESLVQRTLWSFERIEHVDGDTCNNWPDNLRIVQKRSFHERRRKPPKQFSARIRTEYNTPALPFHSHESIFHKDKTAGRIELWVGAYCKKCGDARWQNMFPFGVLDYDRICVHCEAELREGYDPVPWKDRGELSAGTWTTVDRYGHLALYSISDDPEFHIHKEPSATVWKPRTAVDNSTTSCIVKE